MMATLRVEPYGKERFEMKLAWRLKDRAGEAEVRYQSTVHLIANNSLSSEDVTIEQDVLPEVAGAFDVSPETAYWANVREGCLTASASLLGRRTKRLPQDGCAHGRSSES
jgi:hypothetical protein